MANKGNPYRKSNKFGSSSNHDRMLYTPKPKRRVQPSDSSDYHLAKELEAEINNPKAVNNAELDRQMKEAELSGLKNRLADLDWIVIKDSDHRRWLEKERAYLRKKIQELEK